MSASTNGTVSTSSTQDANEIFSIVAKGGNNVALLANNGKYVRSDANGVLTADLAAASDNFSIFQVTYHPNDHVNLLCLGNDRYISQGSSQGNPIRATSPAQTSEATFKVIRILVEGQVIGLRGDNNYYVSARPNQRGEVLANSGVFGTWEKFTVYSRGGRKIGLLAQANNQYVQASEDYEGRFGAWANAIGSWETFEVTYLGDDVIALKADLNGCYVTNDHNEDGRLWARASTIGTWEKFTIYNPPSPSAVYASPLAAAVQTYAPVAYFQTNESYLPCSIEDFLANTEEAADNGLKIKNASIKSGNLATAKAYVNIVVGSTYTDLQYWFLYGYNGAGTAYIKYWVAATIRWPPWESSGPHWEPAGDFSMSPGGQHEGDWEHITVRIRNDNYEAQQVYFAYHSEGDLRTYQSSLRNGRVAFYASRNGHAAYATAERHYPTFKNLGVEFRLLDQTSSPGPFLDTKGKCVIIGAHDTNGVDVPNLVDTALFDRIKKYTGRWGRVVVGKMNIPSGPFGVYKKIIESVGLSGPLAEFDEEKGPEPPWTKASWTQPEF